MIGAFSVTGKFHVALTGMTATKRHRPFVIRKAAVIPLFGFKRAGCYIDVLFGNTNLPGNRDLPARHFTGVKW